MFKNPIISSPVSFTSIHSLKHQEIINPKYLHILYGASKDFYAQRLPIGCIYTNNRGVLSSLSSIGFVDGSLSAVLLLTP